jgi:hypothetical protein
MRLAHVRPDAASVRMPAPVVCPFSIRIPSGRLWMQLCSPLRLVLRAYCLLMDSASCSELAARSWMQLRAPRLLQVHGYSFVLRACCHALASLSCTHAGTTVPEGTTFSCVPLPRLLMKHLQYKVFATTYVKNR